MHTKGPWEAYQYDNKTNIDGLGRQSVCSLAWNGDTEANARLIAQAPAMLKELMIAEQTIRNLGNGELSGDAQDIALNRARVMAEVIRKAKGEV